MRARELGYAVSEEPAISFAATAQAVAERRSDRWRRRVLLACYPVLAAAATWLGFATKPENGIGAFLAAGLLLPLLLGARSIGERYKRRALLENGPWQVWPVRMELYKGNAYSPRRVVLLRPDGSAERAFKAKVPESVWLGYTDGLGLLWFCGDLRFGGVMATPGGSAPWSAEVIEEETRESGRPDEESLVGDLAREAMRSAFREWLA
ncbi:hypothetical protein [Kitasatospora sp. NPDC004272]